MPEDKYPSLRTMYTTYLGQDFCSPTQSIWFPWEFLLEIIESTFRKGISELRVSSAHCAVQVSNRKLRY